MKYSTTLLVLISSFLVFALALTKPSIASGLEVHASDEPVLDTDGEELRAGTEYYIKTFTGFFPAPGGLTMSITRDQVCPLTVVQSRSEVSTGLPVTFTPANPQEGAILVGTDLNIKFIAPSFCGDSNVWRFHESSNSEIKWSISTNGVEGNYGCDTVNNWFRIGKASTTAYKLVFCPTACGGGVCYDIGVRIDSDGQRILSLGVELEPLNVVFIKKPLSSIV